MVRRFAAGGLFVGLLWLLGCDVPDAWKGPKGDAGESAPVQHGSVPPRRTSCGDADAACDVPIGRYSISYMFIGGSCAAESAETGVRFSEDSDELEDFPCEDHEVSKTADNALFIDRECTLLDPETGRVLRRTRARATVRGPNPIGELNGQLDLTVLQGEGAPCTAQYRLYGVRE